jgi:hypothetical protein
LLQTIGPIPTVLALAGVMLVLAIIGTLSPHVRAATGLAHHRVSAA